MCGRFFIREDDLSDITDAARTSPLAERFRAAIGRDLSVSGEIRPMDIVPVIAPDSKGSRAVFPMLWGFSLQDASRPVINARSETAPVKPMFKDAWQRHRCIIPASAYIEWEHLTEENGRKRTGAKYLIKPEGKSSPAYLCGLYRIENSLPRFVVLTRSASEELSRIHDRMPLMLPEQALAAWLDPASLPEQIADLAGQAVTDTDIMPFDAGLPA